MADTDPLRLQDRFRMHPDLDVATHGLTLWDLDREFAIDGFAGKQFMKLRDILGVLRDAYCRTSASSTCTSRTPSSGSGSRSASSVKHDKPDRRRAEVHPAPAQRRRGVRDLPADQVRRAEALLARRRRVGDPADGRGDRPGAPSTASTRSCIGMPHRGRLNVLANIVGKSYAQIFSEFEGNLDPSQAPRLRRRQVPPRRRRHVHPEFGDDDIQVSLAANPSHLEAVDPVLEGIVRAKQDLLDQRRRRRRLHRAAVADARRRRVRRPGRGRRDAEPLAAARLPHRRHRPHRRQQPGRLHHRAGGLAAPRCTAPTSRA